MTLSLPLAVTIPRKRKDDLRFILNLNNYRNAHYHTLNAAKRLYVAHVLAAMADAGVKAGTRLGGPLALCYTLFPKTRRRVDVANPCSIIDKFACDALVHLGVLEDDSADIVRRTVYQFGTVDKDRPRCELEITPC